MDLCNINQIKGLLRRHGFRFSKSMGQNFLIDPDIPYHIAEASGADAHCGVLEIGPGRVLSGFVKKTAPSIRTLAVETADELEAAVAALKGASTCV